MSVFLLKEVSAFMDYGQIKQLAKTTDSTVTSSMSCRVLWNRLIQSILIIFAQPLAVWEWQPEYQTRSH